MPKTRRDILQAIAAQCGGRYAVQVSRITEKRPPPDDFLDRPVTDAEYTSEMKKLDGDRKFVHLPTVKWSLLDHLDDLERKK